MPLDTLYAARCPIVIKGVADLDSSIPLLGIIVSLFQLPAEFLILLLLGYCSFTNMAVAFLYFILNLRH